MFRKWMIGSVVLLSTCVLTAQEAQSDREIKASNPTEFYTVLDARAGILLQSTELEAWEFRLQGDYVIKEKFRLRFQLPFSNAGSSSRLLGSTSVDVNYRLHRRDGRYMATVLGLGFNTPISEDVLLGSLIYDEDAFSYEARANYEGAYRLGKRWILYPRLEYYDRQFESNVTHIISPDTVFSIPGAIRTGLRPSFLVSYDPNTRSFFQVGVGFDVGEWETDEPNLRSNYHWNGHSYRDWHFSLRYQYALGPNSQLYAYWHNSTIWLFRNDEEISKEGRMWIQLGYVYYLP